MMQKTWKMIETLPHGYSSVSNRWELSNKYQHDKVFVFWAIIASALEGLNDLSLIRQLLVTFCCMQQFRLDVSAIKCWAQSPCESLPAFHWWRIYLVPKFWRQFVHWPQGVLYCCCSETTPDARPSNLAGDIYQLCIPE